MASSYPTSLDAFTNPTSGDNLDSPDHATQHADVNDAVEALEAKVGTGSGTPTTGRVLKGGGTAGSSEWADDVPVSDGTLSVGDLVKVKSLSPLVVEGTASGTYAGVGEAVGPRGTTSTQYLAPVGLIDGTTFATANEVIYAVPLWVPSDVTLDRIGCKVNTAGQSGALVRLGIYNADSSTAKPSTLLVDGGTVAGDSTGNKEVTISEAVSAGLYWGVAAIQSAATTRPALAAFRPIGFPYTYNTLANCFNENVYSQTGVSGALNASFGTTFYNAKGPAVVVRVA